MQRFNRAGLLALMACLAAYSACAADSVPPPAPRVSMGEIAGASSTPQERAEKVIQAAAKYGLAKDLSGNQWTSALMAGSFAVLFGSCGVQTGQTVANFYVSDIDNIALRVGQLTPVSPSDTTAAMGMVFRGLLAEDGDNCEVAKVLFNSGKLHKWE